MQKRCWRSPSATTTPRFSSVSAKMTPDKKLYRYMCLLKLISYHSHFESGWHKLISCSHSSSDSFLRVSLKYIQLFMRCFIKIICRHTSRNIITHRWKSDQLGAQSTMFKSDMDDPADCSHFVYLCRQRQRGPSVSVLFTEGINKELNKSIKEKQNVDSR